MPPSEVLSRPGGNANRRVANTSVGWQYNTGATTYYFRTIRQQNKRIILPILSQSSIVKLQNKTLLNSGDVLFFGNIAQGGNV